MVRYLVGKGAGVDIVCFRDEELYLTPLQQAVSSCHMLIANLLIEGCADINKVMGYLGEATERSKYCGNKIIVEGLQVVGVVMQPKIINRKGRCERDNWILETWESSGTLMECSPVLPELDCW
ncbi:hypothetical protein BGZ60DRAFT_400290 [Tricladium varicosporioides]|nr:hypothetical protein BGZ60DRAFT_400290 [Hymenoscyphus varicosporioides]